MLTILQDNLKRATIELAKAQTLAVATRQGSTEFLISEFRSDAHRNAVAVQLEKLIRSIEKLGISLKGL